MKAMMGTVILFVATVGCAPTGKWSFDPVPPTLVYDRSVGVVDCSRAVGRVRIHTVGGALRQDEAWHWVRNRMSADERFPIMNEAASFGCVMVPRLTHDWILRTEGGLQLAVFGAARAGIRQDRLQGVLYALAPDVSRAMRRLQIEELRVVFAVVCENRGSGEAFATRGRADLDVITIRLVVAISCHREGVADGELVAALSYSLATAFLEAFHVEVRLRHGSRPTSTFRIANEAIAHLIEAEFNGRPFIVPNHAFGGNRSSICEIIERGNSGVVSLPSAQEQGDRVYQDDGCVTDQRCDLASTRELRAAMGEVIVMSGFAVLQGQPVPTASVSGMLDQWGTDVTRLEQFVLKNAQCQASAAASLP
jgi:hypothetical protein